LTFAANAAISTSIVGRLHIILAGDVLRDR
jgi:hypothetical protein